MLLSPAGPELRTADRLLRRAALGNNEGVESTRRGMKLVCGQQKQHGMFGKPETTVEVRLYWRSQITETQFGRCFRIAGNSCIFESPHLQAQIPVRVIRHPFNGH